MKGKLIFYEDNFQKEENMDLESFFGLMDRLIKVKFVRVKLREKESLHGLMGKNMREIG